jgi:RHS repeat-associated protein
VSTNSRHLTLLLTFSKLVYSLSLIFLRVLRIRGGSAFFEYDAFGQQHQTVATYSGGSIASEDLPRYAYTSQEQEPLVAGVMYFNRRWYDTSTGRFLFEDPSSFSAGDMNLFAYCGNNPINMTNPTSLCGLWQPSRATSRSGGRRPPPAEDTMVHDPDDGSDCTITESREEITYVDMDTF